MTTLARRDFLRMGVGAVVGSTAPGLVRAIAQEPGQRLPQAAEVRVLNPRMRVPVSFIIDDSTCLVNLAHFAMPQFAEVWPNRDEYKKPWQELPREIPDSFVREFADWCAEHGVKGKYSVVPYPACVGWLDRFLPGWTHRQLVESIELIQKHLLRDWDIHPEMVTHTWVIDTKTGRPYPERSARFMENWGWSEGRSVEELTDYIAYALGILRNIDLPCEGITTPGGFGSRARPQLAQATLAACRDVFRVEIPHYFRDVFTDNRSVAPRVEYAADLEGPDPRCVVSIIGCTGDWFGGWDGLTPGDSDRFITADLSSGRLVDVILKGEPAILVCHWPGIYFNGEKIGLKIFQEVVHRLRRRFEHLVWMKLSEIARYWAAKELTRISFSSNAVELYAPFACPAFTVAVPASARQEPRLVKLPENNVRTLRRVGGALMLEAHTWTTTFQGDSQWTICCFDLPKGLSRLELGAAGASET